VQVDSRVSLQPGPDGWVLVGGRYNAAKTIEAFSARLRDHIDLDSLTAELLHVVNQTMEPTQLSLWLRPPAGSTRGPAPTRRA
jgi:hypothetical protein